MTTSSLPVDLSEQDYVAVGLAHCFVKQEGNVVPIKVLEPIPSAYLEAVLQGIPTSYEAIYGRQLGQVVKNGEPAAADLPNDAQFCEDFTERSLATARTYQTKPELQRTIPLGEVFSELNFSTERKRVLNTTHQVTTEDNVKQHQYTHMTL